MATYLDEIAAFHRDRARRDDRDERELYRAAEKAQSPTSFKDALTLGDQVALIAEIKRRSPSKGVIAKEIDLGEMVSHYVAGGASAISVLTDEKYFRGSMDDLVSVGALCKLPLLRKDFTVSVKDVLDAKIWGASAVLLIVAILAPGELVELLKVAQDLGVDALVEVHTLEELYRALEIGTDIVGVNQRNLHTFEVDYELAVKLLEKIPSGICKVAESGISNREQIERVAAAGCDAVLVGESLMRSRGNGDLVSALSTVPKRGR
jgi:indole-3-glycerol phosphate synthase